MVFNTLIFIAFPLAMASHFAPVVPPSPLSAIAPVSSVSETVRTVLAASHDDLAAWAVSVRACSDDACIALAVSKPIAGADIEGMVRTEKAKSSKFNAAERKLNLVSANLVPVEGNDTAGGNSIKGKDGCVTEMKGPVIPESGQYFCQCGRTCRYWNKHGGMVYC